jgi:hypothetical protein
MFAMSEIGERFHRMSLEALHDLGLSNRAITAYFNRFRSAEHVSRLAWTDTPVQPSRESIKEEPFFGGGDWRWGVRPGRQDFWE